MKYKNLNIRKAIFVLGLSFVLTGCTNEAKENDNSIIISEESEIKEENNLVQINDLPEEIDATSNIIEEEASIVEQVIDYKENAYTTANLNLRDEDNLEGNIITVIDKYQKLTEIESLGLWSYVKYGDSFGFVHNSYLEMLPNDYIEIDISDQNIKYYMGEEILIDSDVVTGHQNQYDTRIGMFEIYSRETSRYLDGSGYSSYVDYWMPFDGGIGLHDATWRDEFGGDIYINSGSHGCVNLPFEIAQTIYENSKVGTKVLVHK